MKTHKIVVNVDNKLLTNIVEEKSAKLSDIEGKDLKRHTKMLADEFLMPFYSYGEVTMNNYCHIHESYSIDCYNKIIKND